VRPAYSLVIALAIGLVVAAPAPSFAAPQAASPTPAPELLATGATVPAFDAEALDGTTRHIDYPKGSSTVLLFFLSSCPHCHKMIPDWNRYYVKHAPNLNIVGVMLDRESPEFFALTPISFPIVRPPKDPDFRKSFKLNHVPLMVRVGPGGKVEDAAQGEIDAIRLGQIFHP
jgi:thiol-disulfide isomerase/thioredoxin